MDDAAGVDSRLLREANPQRKVVADVDDVLLADADRAERTVCNDEAGPVTCSISNWEPQRVVPGAPCIEAIHLAASRICWRDP